MADPIVSIIVTKLSQLLHNYEVNFLEEDKEEVRSLLDEFEYLNILINSYEGKLIKHNIMVPVDQIIDVAHEAEDIYDRYMMNVVKQKRRNKVDKLFLGSNQATMLHDFTVKITKLQTTIGNINKYHIEQKGVSEDTYQFQKEVEVDDDDDDDVVGFLEETWLLQNQLVQGTGELDVLSISGMGGLGKTVLARKVYREVSVRDHFICRAWVSVSQDFKLKELMLAILNQVAPMTDEISMMNAKQLKQEVRKQLSHHRYLVVVDDIWNIEDWDELKGAFPNDKNGSRVIVTTRNEEVTLRASGKPTVQLRFLNGDEGWELFTKKVFRQLHVCPPDLERLGREIVYKCGGLPLAIVALGGLLASKEKTERSWKTMAGTVDYYIARDTRFLDILGLSYGDLPQYLKPCFLYLGLFPEDYQIPARQLIQLWIAEGFIQREDEHMLRKEDVAEDYLHQLIARSLIQVEERRSDGGVKTFRCHDFTRDLCLELSCSENFVESHSGIPSSKTKPRRLSIQCSRGYYILNADPSNTCHVRTLIFSDLDKHKLSKEHWKFFFKCFKLLRVLDLGNREVQMLPKAINNLIFLKYLRVKTVDIAGIPSTICDLDQLQTLDLRRSRINVLPEGIWSMKQLRHLYLDGPIRLPKSAPAGTTNCLSNLQTLCYISQDPAGRVKIAEKAPNLRKLGLHGYKCSSSSSDEQISTFDLRYLESLKFASECTIKYPIQLPPTITKISIKTVHLQRETIKVFQNLSNLRILKLDGASFDDDELIFENGWFPELQLLKIVDSNIVRWKLGRGAVEKLKRVVISKCPALSMLPMELWDITSLQELELLWLPNSITKTIGEPKKSSSLRVIVYPSVTDVASSSV